jgi:hypothetical protein
VVLVTLVGKAFRGHKVLQDYQDFQDNLAQRASKELQAFLEMV